ncbi:MAG: bifunctional oligoribonuclease/PAP phosphatase NrnA [Firmicutes bacterium]|nr:bifunctional oligoribonuclease/PAP phosphatase NrnA [Bacillota bacterium]
MQTNSIAAVARTLKEADSILISGHVMPDGDSIGSTIALGLALGKIDKNVAMTSPHQVPDIYKFLPGSNCVQQGMPEGKFDVFVALDCSVPDRLGDELQSLVNDSVTVVNIDHHQSEKPFADVNYIDSNSASTGEIIYDLLKEMNIELDKNIATNLYTAIASDTGSFKYEGTKPTTHHKIADLLQFDVKVAHVSKSIFDEKPIEVFKVLQIALPTLEVSNCGKVAWISFDLMAKDRISAKDEHTEELVDYPRRIKGVEVALFFREISTGSVKVSMRSNYFVDVNKLAARFNGGGHKRAAGCLIDGGISDVREQIVAAAIEAVQRGSLND